MLICDATSVVSLRALLARFGLRLEQVEHEAPIPGSYRGAPEAGVVGRTVHVRGDTPVHSALHEAAHVICMDEARRRRLHTDAGGDYAEEDAACYLQIVLAQQLAYPSAGCAPTWTPGDTPSGSVTRTPGSPTMRTMRALGSCDVV